MGEENSAGKDAAGIAFGGAGFQIQFRDQTVSYQLPVKEKNVDEEVVAFGHSG